MLGSITLYVKFLSRKCIEKAVLCNFVANAKHMSMFLTPYAHCGQIYICVCNTT